MSKEAPACPKYGQTNKKISQLSVSYVMPIIPAKAGIKSTFVIADHRQTHSKASSDPVSIHHLVISIQSRHCEEPQRRGNLITRI